MAASAARAVPHRVLVHGPMLEELTDLLLFDQLAYPVIRPRLRPHGLAPGSAGYPAQELLPKAILDGLEEAGLLVAPGVLVLPATADLTRTLLDGGDFAGLAAEAGPLLAELTFGGCLDLPANRVQRAAWLSEMDASLARLAALAVARGRHVIPRYHAEDVTRTLMPGWHPVLSVTLAGLPRLHPRPDALQAAIGFLRDPDTARWRARVADWAGEQAGADAGPLPRRLADALAGYRAWIGASGLGAGSAIREFLLAVEPDVIARLAEDDLRYAAERGVFVATRGLSPAARTAGTPGGELACIAHVGRHLKTWWPMMGMSWAA